jgi:DNA-binding response OmpR family regulator
MAHLLHTSQTTPGSISSGESPLTFEQDSPQPAPELQLHRVLVADASPGVCQQVGLALSSLKMEVQFADSIDEAYRMARTQHFHLMIIDVALNDAAGYKFCRTLALDPLTQHIPIVAFTARKSWYSRVKVKLAGCRAYLPKPTRIDEFCRVVQSCIQLRSTQLDLNTEPGFPPV